MTDLSVLFKPQSIAVFGASPDPKKLGHVLLKNLLDYQFEGSLYPINSGGTEVLGLKGKRSLSEVPSPVDLALISIPNKFVYSTLEECASSGVKGAVILSSGFGEMGEEGKEIETKIRDLASRSNLRIVGPNCMGIYNLSYHLNATYFWELPRQEGPLSFISQSGAYGGIFFHELKKRNLKISKFVSIGNMVDLDHADILEYLKGDPSTEIIALFIEEIRDGEKLLRALEGMNKPVIALKGGRTEAGKRAALSHTGSLAGSYEVLEGVAKQSGILLTSSTDEFFDTIKAFSYHRNLLPRGNRTAILTISGGPSVIASDAAESAGLRLPQLDEKTREEISTFLPPFAALSNPVDMTPGAPKENYKEVVSRVLSLDYIDSALAINCGLDSTEFGEAFVEAREKYQKPIQGFSIDNPQIERIFEENGIPLFETPDRCALALKNLWKYAEFQKREKGREKREEQYKREPSPLLTQHLQEGNQQIDEITLRTILFEYGIPIVEEVVSREAGELLKFGEERGYPVVLKIHSPDVLHKTEKKGVLLNIGNEGELERAIQILRDRFGDESFLLVQRQISGAVEILVGAKRDPSFGPILLVGIGGIFTEVYRDISLRRCPIDGETALEMLKELKGFPLLKGFRNLPKVNLEKLAALLVRVSSLVFSHPEIRELDLNPLLALEEDLLVVDTLMVIE